MTIAPTPELGLRERKRRATRRAIQLAVIDLVAERELDGTTVDEISRRADVSPRTFFNYFASKEEALLGDSPEAPDAEVIERFVNAGPRSPLLDDLTLVLLGAARKSMADVEMMQRRHALLKQYPHLLGMRMATMRSFEEQIVQIVAQRLAADDTALASDADALADRARLVTLVAFAVMRHSWARWIDGDPSADLTEQLRGAFRELATLLASETSAKLG
jgi:AcrR family transcriptional regulator